MSGRIRQRRDFEALLRHGRRARTETLWCRYLDEPREPPLHVGFAIGRAVGSAVVRNRLRRRLRAVVAATAPAQGLDHGTLLVGAHPSATERSFGELRDELGILLARSG